MYMSKAVLLWNLRLVSMVAAYIMRNSLTGRNMSSVCQKVKILHCLHDLPGSDLTKSPLPPLSLSAQQQQQQQPREKAY